MSEALREKDTFIKAFITFFLNLPYILWFILAPFKVEDVQTCFNLKCIV